MHQFDFIILIEVSLNHKIGAEAMATDSIKDQRVNLGLLSAHCHSTVEINFLLKVFTKSKILRLVL